MNMPTHQDEPVQLVGYPTVGQAHVRRRQLLGLLLLVVGSGWCYLRVTGRIGDVSLPICWLEGPAAVLDRFNIGCGARSVPAAAYGMLAASTMRYIQQNHAE